MSTEIVDAYVAPVSHAQRRLWFLHRLDPASAVYNIPIAVRFQGALRIDLVEKSISKILERHDSLRTTFALEDGVPVQVVQSFSGWRLSTREISQLNSLHEVLTHKAAEPFDLAAGPLFRASLFRLDERDHVLLLTMHHIVADGWSMNLLVREFTELYTQYASGQTPTLRELPIQFPDFVEWQYQQLSEDQGDSRLQFWREHLAGAPFVLDLPADAPRPAEQSYQGDSLAHLLPGDVSRRLSQLAREQDVTLFVLLLAVFETLLARCARQDQFLIGTPVAGRSHPDTEELVGFFVNTVVLRADVKGAPTFLELLKSVRSECLEVFSRDDVPFDRVVHAVQPERDRSRTPLFQTYFTLQKNGRPHLKLPDIIVSLVDIDLKTAKVDLTLEVEETNEGLLARWNYVSDVFKAETVRQWARLFQTLCESVVAAPTQRVSRLPLLPSEERHELIAAGCETESFESADAPATLNEWFVLTASTYADRVAIRDGSRDITYAELDRESNRVASYLTALGIGPEKFVGICLPRSSDLLVAALGVLKTGAAYVPIDPAYPPDRIGFMVKDSGVSAVLTRGEVSGLPAERRIDLTGITSATTELTFSPSVANHGPDNAAYVIYTSGSTGKPKGCVVTHRNVTRLMRATESWFGFGPECVWTLFHSFAFDFSVWEMWGPLLYGGTLVIVSYEVSRSPEAFHHLLAAEQVTVLNQTPSAFRQLMAVDKESAACLPLRFVIFGGEALELSTLRPWVEKYGDRAPQLVNMYGITETTVHVTYRLISRADIEGGVGSVIGVPIPDLGLHVVDAHLEPVPIGVPGEIVVSGAGLARGYLHRPELTAERFVPNPFAPGRLYRSGDLARRMSDGGLEYLGRIDQQVKIRGFRIELGEIEKALIRIPSIREAVVVPYSEGSNEKRLVAYLTVHAASSAPFVMEIRDLCRAWLPDYMVPSAFVFLPSLPLTAHGKVDHRSLPSPTVATSASMAAYTEPHSEAEVELANIWQRVLGVPRVGTQDNFFALGGDSILTIQVVTQARKAGLQLAPKDLFECQTLAELARATKPLASGGPKRSNSNLLLDVQDINYLSTAGISFEDAYPLVPMQAGMLFQALLEPERDVYFEQVSGEIGGVLNADAFRSAWQGLMDRHPALRTSFIWKEVKEPIQVVHPEVSLVWAELDWSGMSASGQTAAWNEYLAADRRRGFAYDQAPLWRVCLTRIAPDRWRWLWSHFHALLDGWCLPLVFADVLAEYESQVDGSGVRPLRGLPYRPYVEWVGSQNREKAERYWRETLNGFDNPPVLRLPPPSPGKEATEDVCQVRLSLIESASLREWTRSHGLTLNTLFQGAWAFVLSRYGLGSDVVFGVTVSGRPAELEGADRTIGLFINTLPLRVQVENSATTVEWLQQLQQAQARMRQFEHTPLADVQSWSEVANGQPLFESILVFENYPGDDLLRSMRSSLRLENFHTNERTNYLLTAAVLPGEQIALKLHFDTRRFEAGAASRMLEAWARLVQDVVRSERALLGGLDVLSDAHVEKLLGWSADPAPTEHGLTVIDLIAEHARRSPDAAALLASGVEVSYGELVSRSSRLARELRASGVAPETVVAVCMQKSPELVIAWLAVLKAGAAFLPLDPQFASVRLQDILFDAKPALLLAHGPTLAIGQSTGLPLLQVANYPRESSGVGNEKPIAIDPAYLAYIIYTSGSTGKPKGVMLNHAGLINLSVSQAAICGLGPGRRGLQFASVSFDAAVSEVFMALVSGAAIWIEERDPVPDPTAFAALVKNARIDHATLPPAFLQALPMDQFHGLRTLLIAGEAASQELYRRWSKDRDVFNAYGPTETTVCVTMEKVPNDPRQVTLGRPLNDVTVYITDETLNLRPIGVSGEIVVGGIGVARGYLKRPDLTAESFVPDPFANQAGSRLYRTGDLGRWTADGRLEFLGRADRQLKIRGFRVEPGELEAALMADPAVRDAVAIGGNDDQHGSYLTAYVLKHAESEITGTELLESLRLKLPSYLIPQRLVVLSSWPLTSAGKVDRRALEALSTPLPEETKIEYHWADDREQSLASIWKDVLRVASIGPDDNFFELGGDSILSLQIIARAHQAGLKITPRQIFAQPTVRRLASVAERTVAALDNEDSNTGWIPLTPIQKWFFDQNQPEPHHWNQSLMLELRDASLLSVMEPALTAVVRHHRAFRLRFQRDDKGQWLQALDAGEQSIAVEIRTFPEADLQIVTEELQTSLNLQFGPLLRAAIFNRGLSRPPLLFLAIHHLIVDGVFLENSG